MPSALCLPQLTSFLTSGSRSLRQQGQAASEPPLQGPGGQAKVQQLSLESGSPRPAVEPFREGLGGPKSAGGVGLRWRKTSVQMHGVGRKGLVTHLSLRHAGLRGAWNWLEQKQWDPA